MVLHIHNDDTDKLNIADVANEFVMEDLCKIFLLSFTVSTCLKCSQISTAKTKILSMALQQI